MDGATSFSENHQYEDEEMPYYRKNANAVVTFNLVYDKQDLLEPALNFKPVMCHQIFGESETVFGFRSIAINLYYLHNSAQCYLNLFCSGEIKSDLHSSDNVMELLNPWLPEKFTTNKKVFTSWIKKEAHDVIYGNLVFEFSGKSKFHLDKGVEVDSKYKIMQCDLKNEAFKSFHSRFETYVIWYIDGANFIDLEDEKWEIFYVYEEVEHPKTKKKFVTPIGFCTVYKFFAYPQNIRSRISQFFILPSHQKRGIGTKLYRTIFKVFQENPLVTDITVEEPTSTFQKIRDIHDCVLVRNCLKDNNAEVLTTPIKKLFGFMKKLKIGKRQSQRIYDVLCGYESIKNKQSYEQFLKNIYKRIETEVKEKLRGSKKMRPLDGNEVNVAMEFKALAEEEFKAYKEDLESSIKHVKSHFV